MLLMIKYATPSNSNNWSNGTKPAQARNSAITPVALRTKSTNVRSENR